MKRKYTIRNPKKYAMYKGYELLAEGTRDEICEKMNIKKETFYFYRTEIYLKRRKNLDNARIIVKECEDEI